MEHLRNLQRLFEDGFISAAEYEHRRQQLIDKLTDTTLAPSAEEDCEGERSSSSSQRKARKEMRRYSYRDMVPSTRRAATSTTSTSTTSAYDSDVVRSSRAHSLLPQPYGTSTSSCAPAADPVMDMAHKYTLSRKIGQLPEEALPSVLKIVEQLSPKNLRQSGEDWTFDLETLEDHTLWKLNDFVNAQIKHHFGGKDNTAWDNHEAGMVEEEKPYSTTVTTESDLEEDDDDDQDAGLELNDDEWHDAQDDSGVAYYQDLPKHTEELKGAKRPRSYLLFGAGEKRKRKEDIKKKDKEQRERERERATTAAKRTYSQVKERDSDEGEDMPGRSGGSIMRRTAEAMHLTREREVIDEMENESESEYEREEYEDPEYTTDTQLKQEDDEDEGSDGDEEESDEDWTPADAKPRDRSDEEPLQTGMGWVKSELEPESEMDRVGERKAASLPPPPMDVTKREPSRDEVPAVGSDSGAPRKTFKIQVCVYSLAKKSNTKRPYVCDACDKSFADRSNLIQHLRVHTKEKPYGCTYEGCEKRFAHSASLKEHLYTHTGDKPHLCHCGMSFAQASNLRRHQLVHTGEKPFACTVKGCKKSFTQKINLAQHLKRVHRITDHDLDNEDLGVRSGAGKRPAKRSRQSTSTTTTSTSASYATPSTSNASQLGSR